MRVPLERYLLWLPASALLFVALAVADQRNVFFSALPRGAAETGSREAGVAAEGVVRAFAAALAEAYRQGDVGPLGTIPLSPELRVEIEQELRHPIGRELARGLELSELRIVSIELLAEAGWVVITEESWGAPGGTRLRYRYVLSGPERTLRIDAAMPQLPEPVP